MQEQAFKVNKKTVLFVVKGWSAFIIDGKKKSLNIWNKYLDTVLILFIFKESEINPKWNLKQLEGNPNSIWDDFKLHTFVECPNSFYVYEMFKH